MIKVKAKIKLFKGDNKRQTPFISGYRPLFKFIKEIKTSGEVTLINQDKFNPGEEGVVEISFLYEEYLGMNFGVGTLFCFYESEEPLGQGKILDLL